MRYAVTYEVRRVGAIGIFYPHTEEIEASSEESARQVFRAMVNDRFETRNPLGCKPLFPENDWGDHNSDEDPEPHFGDSSDLN